MADLEEMIRNELLQAGCVDGPDCEISGPTVCLSQKTAELIGLTIHELTTNSIKFGALARGGGLRVQWSMTEHNGSSLLNLRWTETGFSPLTDAPRASGFGRQLIEEALPYQLGAETSFRLKPGELDCSIQLPIPDQPAAIPQDDESPLLPTEEESF